MNKKNIFLTVCIACAAAILAGCAIAGNLATPTDSEKVTPAEFKLTDTEGKIAVIVNQPGWIKTPTDLRISLTDLTNKSLVAKAGINKTRLIEYTDILNTRRELPEDKKDEPNAIAAKLNVQYILHIQIMDFDLSTFGEKDLFNGTLTANACLLDAKGNKIWPLDKNSKAVTVNIEDEKGTIESAVGQLSAATAYCITRYLYDCKTVRFRVPEEPKGLDSYDF